MTSKTPPLGEGEQSPSKAPITKVDRLQRTPRLVHGSHQELKIGGILRQRFLLLAELGTGGMGTVYRAKDLVESTAQADKTIAIKVLCSDFREHPQAFTAFQKEANKTLSLTHPNIVKVFEFFLFKENSNNAI